MRGKRGEERKGPFNLAFSLEEVRNMMKSLLLVSIFSKVDGPEDMEARRLWTRLHGLLGGEEGKEEKSGRGRKKGKAV